MMPWMLLAMALFAGGCTATKVAEERAAQAIRHNAELQGEIDRLQSRLERQNVVTARLQMELVRYKEETKRRAASRQGAARDNGGNTIRTAAASTKVETVAYLAEVTTEIETARGKSGPAEQEVFARADTLMQESNTALEAERFEQASLLAAQALELIDPKESATVGGAPSVAEVYADFIAPLELKVATASNIRKTPSRRGRLLTTAAAETAVTAIGHKGCWIKISLQDGRQGWIYYTLLSIPDKLNSMKSSKPRSS